MEYIRSQLQIATSTSMHCMLARLPPCMLAENIDRLLRDLICLSDFPLACSLSGSRMCSFAVLNVARCPKSCLGGVLHALAGSISFTSPAILDKNLVLDRGFASRRFACFGLSSMAAILLAQSLFLDEACLIYEICLPIEIASWIPAGLESSRETNARRPRNTEVRSRIIF